jgi:hypothetical protein
VNNQVKIPNSKHQITNKSQIPIFNDQNKNQVWSAGGGLVPPSADYLPFDLAQGGESFDAAQDREPVERLVEPFDICDL